jgi:diaminopimelate decarboxylase
MTISAVNGTANGKAELEPLKFLSPDEVRHVADTFGTPVFVYDEESIEGAVGRMASLPNAFGLDVRYSIKACPTGAILRLVDSMGLLFDSSSTWEALRAVHAGVSADKILLTAQETPMDDNLVGLIKDGLEFDACSLRQIQLYGEKFEGGPVSLRFNPGFGSGLVNRLTSGGPNSSFGIWHEQLDEVKKLVDRYGLVVKRLHVHTGSSHKPEVLVRAATALLDLARHFEEATILNLGGGYKVKAMLDEPEWDHSAWASQVAADISHFAAETGRQLRLEVEPGTYLMVNSGSIVTRVIDKVTTGAQGHTFLKIDAGLTEILRPSYYGAPHPLVVVPQEDREEAPEACVVSGHCCIAGDVLTTERNEVEKLAPRLLAHAEPGDCLVIERGGGYTASMAMKNFNSFPEAAEVLRTKDGSFVLVKSRQTFEQLVQNELVPTPAI